MAKRKNGRKSAQQKRFAQASKACSLAGKKPGTKGFGACMRQKLRGKGPRGAKARRR